MKGILINFTIVLVSYLCLLASLEAGCMGEDEIMVLKNNDDYACISTISPQERIKREKERRENYLRDTYPGEVKKFKENQTEVDVSDLKVKDPIVKNYQGKKTWQEANDHCKGLGMRLPTERELAYAFQSGLTKKWNGGGVILWTDKENSSVNLKYYNHLYTKDSILGFTCYENSFQLTNPQERNIPIISNWIFSDNLGEMIFSEADSKCTSSGMRLPTIDELKEAHNAGITKSWQKDGNLYWSSTPYDAERYYLLNVDIGNTYYYNRFGSLSVRCRR